MTQTQANVQDTPVEQRPYPVPVPEKMRGLPVDPKTRHIVPWFVARLDDGSYDFRAIGGEMVGDRMVSKVTTARLYNKCWLCGQWMGGGDKWFVIGPMCAVNRTSSEPPSHHDCAVFAVQVCPFLVHPKAVRREANMPEGLGDPAGYMIDRNPGVTLLWQTRRMGVRDDRKGGVLYDIGEPLAWEWWTQGRPATRAEVEASIDSGIPLLRKQCEKERPERRRAAHAHLDAQILRGMTYLPPEPPPEVQTNG